MNGDTAFHRPIHTLLNHGITQTDGVNRVGDMKKKKKKKKKNGGMFRDAMFMKWTREDVLGVVKYHPVPCLFAASLFFFMGVEYTLYMIPPSSPPFDLGFVATLSLHRLLASTPALNSLLAGLNTGFLGSGVDFPVGNVSFFLFYSGHVAASIIASLDMKRMQRWKLARAFDTLNVLQVVRLLSTRGHYTIDLAVGVGAGMLFDSLASSYEESKKIVYGVSTPNAATTTTIANGDFLISSKQ